jgi:hypothetical protein
MRDVQEGYGNMMGCRQGPLALVDQKYMRLKHPGSEVRSQGPHLNGKVH